MSQKTRVQKNMVGVHFSPEGLIPRLSDPVANRKNCESIDRLVTPRNHQYIIAWGKWLGFTPETVQTSVDEAARDNAPADALQKIDGRWLLLTDIQNDANRRQVERLATGKQPC